MPISLSANWPLRSDLQLGHGQSAVTSRLDYVFTTTEGL
jgi:hypothetical protein